MTAGMFDPVPKGTAASTPRPAAPEWRVILPAPEDAPAPPAKHPKLGAPSSTWPYHDAAGRLLGTVCRFNVEGGGKEIRSLVYAEHKKWGRAWRWLGFPRPRPLYRADRLALQPEASVIVCEGEKSADAAGELRPDHVAITSPGGSKAARAADWSALAGRQVVIWPDADEPGQEYARAVLDMLARLSPMPAVAIVKPPEDVAEGWDAADALAEGWTPDQAASLVAAATLADAGDIDAPASRRRKAGRDGLLDLLGDAELWHDPERIAYATVPVDGHRENHEVLSRGFRGWLAWRAYEAAGASPSGQVIDDACRIAEALALNRGPCLATWRRVAEYDGRIYLDIGCSKWRAVEIAATGWRMVDVAPVKFLRSRGAEALPEPEAGETIEALREFVNVEHEGDFRLILSFLVAALRPAGPYPVLTLTGQQGSSKSSLARICRRLTDPNASPIRSVPKDERDLIVSAFNAWLMVFDNLSSVPVWLSDALARLSTGGGFATRQLHSDRDEMLFTAQRPIILNGIGDLATRPDLADRALSITLPPLGDDKRREERKFWAAFERARPGILGALLDAVAAGLRHLPDTVLVRPPRMADFATWAEACGPGFGWAPGEFLRDYEDNRTDAIAAAAEASPLLPAIEAVLGRGGLMADGFDGTAAELLAKLHDVCSPVEQKARWFPATASQVGSALRRVAPLLRSRSIIFEPYKDRDKKRTRRIVLRCASEAVFDELHLRLMGQHKGDGEGDE
jgi:putative DNA primase/helicase